MRTLPVVLIGMLLLFSIGCNNNSAGETKVTGSTEQALEFPLNIQKGGEFVSLDQIRVQARALIEHRIGQNNKALAMLTTGYWWPEFVFNSGSMSKVDEYAGHWLKFNDDFSYNYGIYDKTLGTGKYHFRLDDNKLHMLDNNVEFEPKVWQANYNGQVIALVGTHEYGVNNGMQIKMLGLDQKPVQ